nr:FecR family protein [uncultured Draconibacterium sp.]
MKEQIKNTIARGRKTESYRQEMLSLFHKPENEFEVKEVLLENLLDEKSSSSELPNMKSLFNKLWRKIELEQKQRYNKKRYLIYWTRIAAAVIIGLLAGAYVTSLLQTNTEPVYYAAHSPKGSVSQLIMPDSTIVFLNADSRVRYQMEGNKKNREVYLEGEAWFDVAKNKKKPFIVHTPVYDVKVTGTQFNIKAYKSDSELTTTLEEGQILIQSAGDFRLAEDIVVKPGEQVILNKDSKEISIKNVNPEWFSSWKDNKLVFVNMDLKELVVLLERKYGVDIEVKNKEILKLHFDGTIKNESIIEFLEIIKNTLPIDYKVVGQKIEITNSK